jgi:hypothetical protein
MNWSCILGSLAILVPAFLVLYLENRARHRRLQAVANRHGFCRWCFYRDRFRCTHAESPVNEQASHGFWEGECAPVCLGRARCDNRVEDRAGRH